MKSVLISIHPKWCEKILSGEKTIEVRKTAPKEVPFKVFIYCTRAKTLWRYSSYEGAYENSNGEVVYAQQHIIGEFICDKVDEIILNYNFEKDGNKLIDGICLTENELERYAQGRKTLYGWHISGLKIYDKPKRLSEFYAKCTVSDKKCRLCENCYNRENPYGRDYAVKKIARPPQNYMFIDDL